MPQNSYATVEEAFAAVRIPFPDKPIPFDEFERWGAKGRYYAIQNEKCVCFGDWKAGEDYKWFPPTGSKAARMLKEQSSANQPARGNERVTTDIHHDIARRIWRASQPAKGTLVQTYLESRGYFGDIPATLRFHPGLKHVPSGKTFPAMVASVCVCPDRKVIGVHRTFLAPDGNGKADEAQTKMRLGSAIGGAVRLAPADETLAVAEGIETALSVMAATSLSAWSALSANGIETLMLPPLPLARNIIICADNDANGRGQQAAQRAAQRWMAEGRSVRIAIPPVEGQDFNDILMGA